MDWAEEKGIQVATDWVCNPSKGWDDSLTNQIAAALREAYEAGRKDENEACAIAISASDLDGEHELCVDIIREQHSPNASIISKQVGPCPVSETREPATEAPRPAHSKSWACTKPDGDGCDGNHTPEATVRKDD